MSDLSTSRIVLLKQRRGLVAAFGQTEKVKAIDVEIAKLRREHDAARESEPRSEPPAPEVETAVADTSRVESAAVSARRGAAAKKRRASAAKGD
jgi:hypothetical protein